MFRLFASFTDCYYCLEAYTAFCEMSRTGALNFKLFLSDKLYNFFIYIGAIIFQFIPFDPELHFVKSVSIWAL